MAVGPALEKVIRIGGTLVAILFVVTAGYILVKGQQSTSTQESGKQGILPTIEKIFTPAPTEPKVSTPTPSTKTPTPPTEPTTKTTIDIVSKVTATADPSSFSGTCPHTFQFTGTITTTSATTVKYQWYDSNGTWDTEQTLTFDAAGTKSVAPHTWSTSASGFVKLRVNSPQETAAKADFTLTCS